MNKLLVLSLLLVVYIGGYSQKKAVYEGYFNNGLPVKGYARYSYLPGPRGSKIKDGNFRYTVKEKTREYRFIQSFSGEYSRDLKQGEWEYSTRTKDYGRDDEGYFRSSEIQLTAHYDHGMPVGEWLYRALITRRRQSKTKDKIVWTQPDTLSQVKMLLHFNAAGVLCDSLQVVDALRGRVDVLMDGRGMLQAYRYALDGQEYERQYREGLSYSLEAGGRKQEDESYAFYSANRKAEGELFVLKRHSLLDRPDEVVKTYLDAQVFNASYFLLSYIRGERFIRFDSRGRLQGVDYKGLYYKQPEPLVGAYAEKAYTDLRYKSSKVSSALKLVSARLKANPGDRELKRRRGELQLLNKQMKRVWCYAVLTREELVPALLLKKAEKKCGTLPGLPAAFRNNDELLKWLIRYSNGLKNKAEKLSVE